jgi:hypothetical protein
MLRKSSTVLGNTLCPACCGTMNDRSSILVGLNPVIVMLPEYSHLLGMRPERCNDNDEHRQKDGMPTQSDLYPRNNSAWQTSVFRTKTNNVAAEPPPPHILTPQSLLVPDANN